MTTKPAARMASGLRVVVRAQSPPVVVMVSLWRLGWPAWVCWAQAPPFALVRLWRATCAVLPWASPSVPLGRGCGMLQWLMRGGPPSLKPIRVVLGRLVLLLVAPLLRLGGTQHV